LPVAPLKRGFSRFASTRASGLSYIVPPLAIEVEPDVPSHRFSDSGIQELRAAAMAPSICFEVNDDLDIFRYDPPELSRMPLASAAADHAASMTAWVTGW
jgi:hypothetical protein